MNAETQGGLLILTGGVVARMSLTGTYLLYVRQGMRPWLLISALVLLVLGVLRIWSALRPAPAAPTPATAPAPAATPTPAGAPTPAPATTTAAAPDTATAAATATAPVTAPVTAAATHADHPDHPDHHDLHGPDGLHAPRVAWLLVLPVIAVVLIAPNPLGSFTAARQSATAAVAAPPDPFPPLKAGSDGTVALPVMEYVRRALFDDRRSLAGVPVRLVGMVAPAGEDGTEDFRLVRFMIACCAADAQAVQVAVHGTPGRIPPTDSWVEVVGRWRPPAGDAATDDQVPPFVAEQMQTVPRPEIPYEG